jgi:hypothetical protein
VHRDLLQQLAAQSASGAVQRQLRLGNADLAAANLARESEIAELRNQIAIIRCSYRWLALVWPCNHGPLNNLGFLDQTARCH